MGSVTCYELIFDLDIGDYNLSLSKRDREQEREFAETARDD